jgi:hypothetical protein
MPNPQVTQLVDPAQAQTHQLAILREAMSITVARYSQPSQAET